MACYKPLVAHQARPGASLLFGVAPPGGRRLSVPCGQCIGCRLEHCRQWAARCVHEAQLHEFSCFVTFTYSDAHVPSDFSLRPEDFTLFMKRLRERFGKVRYFMCGEYGELTRRPHYHAILFGYYPDDREFYKKSSSGFDIFTSKSLDEVWQLGCCYVGDVSAESAGYVARYALKKVDAELSGAKVAEYARMSRRPGIGAGWIDKYFGDVYPHDRIVIGGCEHRVPRFYDKRLEALNPLYLAELKAQRAEVARKAEDRRAELVGARRVRLHEVKPTDRYVDVDRLSAHELVKRAAIKHLKREL